MEKKEKKRILWGICLAITMMVFTIGVDPLNIKNPSFLIYSLLSLILFFLHATWKLGFSRGLMLISLASLIGFAFEFLGLKYGILFGGHYEYLGPGFELALGNVPLIVIFFWGLLIYVGYSVVNSFLLWTKKRKPSKDQRNIMLLPLLVISDGLVVTFLDVFLDPLQVRVGNWIWVEGGPYFGIPIGNFIGWFIVVALATGIFRTFEYFYPQKTPQIGRTVSLIPIIGYSWSFFALLVSAIENQMTGLEIIGLLTMFPIIIINLILFALFALEIFQAILFTKLLKLAKSALRVFRNL